MTKALANHANAEVLRNASFASLEGSALTPAAKKLVEVLNKRVVAQVTLQEVKPNAKKTNRAKLKKAVEAFLADLLMAQMGKQPKRWVYRALKPERFTGAPVGYRVFVPLQQALRELGLVEHRPGVDQWTLGFGQGDEPGPALVANRWAARFSARPELLKLCTAHGVPPSKASDHFDFGLPKQPLQKRAASKRDAYGNKARGKVMKFDHTKASLKLEADVFELNEYLAKQSIEGGVHGGYVRIFQNGNLPAFDWNFGGRLYSQPSGDTNYQQQKGTQRRRMTINGAPVVEIDIRASYLTIFHAWHRVQLDREADPYAIRGLGKAGRDAVKLWMVATFGSTQPLTRWPRELLKDYNETHRVPLDRKRFSVANIREKVVAQYPLVARWGQPFKGHIRTWADLMFDESRVVIDTMLFLMRTHDIPSLAVHDSIIVPQTQADLAAKVLRSVFWGHLKAMPLVKFNQPTTKRSSRSALDH